MQPMPPITFAITRNPDGSISINGPIQDKMLCYGLIEMGRDAVRTYHEQANKTAIQVVPEGALPALQLDRTH